MEWGFLFIFNSVLLGVGLAMDAFSVSLTNGLNEPDMKRGRMCGIAGMFAGFQALMPMLGWICVRTVVQYFVMFDKFIPWLALVLLVYIGGKMLIDGILRRKKRESGQGLCFFRELLLPSTLYQWVLRLRDTDGLGPCPLL